MLSARAVVIGKETSTSHRLTSKLSPFIAQLGRN
jgi:hypothetical protein